MGLTKWSRIVLDIHLDLQSLMRDLRHGHRFWIRANNAREARNDAITLLVLKESDLCNKRIRGGVETKCHRQRSVH